MSASTFENYILDSSRDVDSPDGCLTITGSFAASLLDQLSPEGRTIAEHERLLIQTVAPFSGAYDVRRWLAVVSSATESGSSRGSQGLFERGMRRGLGDPSWRKAICTLYVVMFVGGGGRAPGARKATRRRLGEFIESSAPWVYEGWDAT